MEIVGYLLEELRDPANYAQFQKDVSEANIFIGSLIFIEELANKVRVPAGLTALYCVLSLSSVSSRRRRGGGRRCCWWWSFFLGPPIVFPPFSLLLCHPIAWGLGSGLLVAVEGCKAV